MKKIDRLGWAAGISFSAYGIKIGIRVNDPTVLERLSDCLPLGWQPSSDPIVENLYSLVVGGNGPYKGIRRYNLLYNGATRISRTMDLDETLYKLENDLQIIVSFYSRKGLFVHAGTVGWQGQAIVIAGRSMTGKTTLVAALLKLGATYYSDEYAIFNKQGLLLPYPRMLSMRDEQGQWDHNCPPEELGAEIGIKPLPVGLIVLTKYQLGARWLPRSLSSGKTLLALLDNTAVARTQPERALATLRRVVSGAIAVKGKRPEAEEMAEQLLDLIAVQ